MKQRLPFQPLDEDMDTKIEALAQEKGVSTLVKASRLEQNPSEKPKILVTNEPAPLRTAMKALNVELPDYVWKALKIRAAERQTSVRHIIMSALRADGICIVETDMIDASLRTRRGHS
ncbi:hypothetical protein [Bradyrhizobium sp.]|uniref:hypothetical protein n=1 Tax=Bradyrhizobium sp. TaxID=376 RepID=UPI0039E52245